MFKIKDSTKSRIMAEEWIDYKIEYLPEEPSMDKVKLYYNYDNSNLLKYTFQKILNKVFKWEFQEDLNVTDFSNISDDFFYLTYYTEQKALGNTTKSNCELFDLLIGMLLSKHTVEAKKTIPREFNPYLDVALEVSKELQKEEKFNEGVFLKCISIMKKSIKELQEAEFRGTI